MLLNELGDLAIRNRIKIYGGKAGHFFPYNMGRSSYSHLKKNEIGIILSTGEIHSSITSVSNVFSR